MTQSSTRRFRRLTIGFIAVLLVVSMIGIRRTFAASINKNDINVAIEPFKLVDNYSEPGGVPTGEGSFLSNGEQVGPYVEGSCIPISMNVTNNSQITGDMQLELVYDYHQTGNATDVVGIDHMERIDTNTSEDPATVITNLNQLAFLGTDLTETIEYITDSGATVTAAITGPFGDDAGETPIDPEDTDRHYKIELQSVDPGETVYVSTCARLGLDASEFPGASMHVQPGKGNGSGSVKIDPKSLIELPSLTLEKTVVGDALPETFWFSVTPAINGVSTFSVPSGQSSVFIDNIDVDGTYTITEHGPEGYVFESGSGTNCSFTGDVASASVAAGKPAEDAVCSFTNTAVLETQIIVNSVVINDNGGTLASSSVTLFIDGVTTTDGVAVDVSAGDYVISAAAEPGYSVTLSGDCDEAGLVLILEGETKECTVTHDDIGPTLLVETLVINNDDGTKETNDFEISVDGENVSTSTFAGDPDGVLVTLNAGEYSVSGAPQVDYVQAASLGCSGAISLGENLVCTITYGDIGETSPSASATLTVIKKVTNDNGGSDLAEDFIIFIDATNPSSDSFSGAEDPGTTITLDAGSYSVSASEFAGYTTLLSKGCHGDIAVDDKAGRICTVTSNDKPATLNVITTMVNSDGGAKTIADALISVSGENVSTSTFSGSDGTAVTLDAGAYSVYGAALDGYTHTFSSGCTGTAEVGDSFTCTIAYDDIYDGGTGGTGGEPAGETPTPTSTLDIIVEVVNDDGLDAAASDFEITVDAANASAVSFSGSVSNTAVTIDEGDYDVSVDIGGLYYDAVLGESCSGTTEGGEVITCTITLDDIALVISNIQITALAENAIQLTWDTNHPATSRVIYDLVSHEGLGEPDTYGYANTNEEDSTLTTSHLMQIFDLVPSTQYFARPVSHGSPEVVGDEVSVTTLAPAGDNSGGSGGTPSGRPIIRPETSAPPQEVLGEKITAPEDPEPEISSEPSVVEEAPKEVLGFTTLPTTGGKSTRSVSILSLVAVLLIVVGFSILGRVRGLNR